jgi:tetratricopeptide (TPR) repeat protein
VGLLLGALAAAAWAQSVAARNEYKVARILVTQSKYQEALQHLERAVREEPHYADAHYLMGLCYLGLKDYPRAEGKFRLITSMMPGFLGGWSYLAQTYLEQKKYPEAIRTFQDLARVRGMRGEASFGLGVVAYAQQDLAGAEKHWKEALTFDPKMAKVRNNLGILYQLRGDLARATEQYQEAVRLEPERMLYRFNLGLAMLEMGRRAPALEHLNRVKVSSASGLAAAAAAALALDAGRAQDAESYARSALKENPDLSQACLLLGRALESQGRLEEARQVYSQALESDPNLAWARQALERLPAPSPGASPGGPPGPAPSPGVSPGGPPGPAPSPGASPGGQPEAAPSPGVSPGRPPGPAPWPGVSPGGQPSASPAGRASP